MSRWGIGQYRFPERHALPDMNVGPADLPPAQYRAIGVQHMKQVICFGEALIDFLNTGTQADDLLNLDTFTQFPGGAPANAAVAVAKLGGQSAFAGQVGDDHFGHFLVESLRAHGVSTRLTATHPAAKTALAFVFLDDVGERSFAFYRDNTADMVISKDQVSADWFAGQPIFHYCSNTLTEPAMAEVTHHAVSLARGSEGSLISFDVNLRHNLWPSGTAGAESVNEMVYRSHLIKFSREEFDFLCGGNPDTYLARCFAQGVVAALVTDGANTISVHTQDWTFTLDPPTAKAIDTTGGGDAFIGAILYGLSLYDEPLETLADLHGMKPLVRFAAHCGAFTVSRRGVFPALPTFDDVRQEWKSRHDL